MKSPRLSAAVARGGARSERPGVQCLEHGLRGKRNDGQREASWAAGNSGRGGEVAETMLASDCGHVAEETRQFLEQMRSRFSADAVEERARQSLSREVCEKREEVHALADRAL